MVIDSNKLQEEKVERFKGGEDYVLNRCFEDKDNKIVKSILPPNCSSGLHPHTNGCEILYMLKGSAIFSYDDKQERVFAGQVHYCPKGHKHSMLNDTNENIEYFTIVVKE